MKINIFSKNYIMIIILLTIKLSFSAQKLSFYKEIITIQVFEEYCTVDGEYYFKNDNNISTMILYPFVINDRLSYPDSISILSKDHKSINFKRNKKNVTFPFRESDYFKAFYQQKTTNYFEYILTTTQTWGKALEEADFIIKVHNNLELANLSLTYNKKDLTDKFSIYYITKKNYFPKKNIIIEWIKK